MSNAKCLTSASHETKGSEAWLGCEHTLTSRNSQKLKHRRCKHSVNEADNADSYDHREIQEKM